MKTLRIGIVAILMIVSNLGWAQQPAHVQKSKASKTPEERATALSNNLTDKLGLTADQQKSVYNFCLQRSQQEDTDKAKFLKDKVALKNARKQNNQDFEKNMNSVLTPDQKTKYEQFIKEGKAKVNKRKANPPVKK